MKTLEPLTPGSERTVCSAGVANTLIEGANRINSLRGNGVKVTHSDSNIVIDLDCPVPRRFSINHSFPYYHVGNPPHSTALMCPPAVTAFIDYFTIIDSNTIGAEFTFDLLEAFPYVNEEAIPKFFHDGICPIKPRFPIGVTDFPQTQPSPGVGWRDHPIGAFTIGPFSKRMIVFSATHITGDDFVYYSVDGGPDVMLAEGLTPGFGKNNPIAFLETGSTIRFRNIESGGGYVWAAGIVGVKHPRCCPKEWRAALGI